MHGKVMELTPKTLATIGATFHGIMRRGRARIWTLARPQIFEIGTHHAAATSSGHGLISCIWDELETCQLVVRVFGVICQRVEGRRKQG